MLKARHLSRGQNYQAFLQDRVDWGGVVATYIGLPLFFAVWAAYRLVSGGGIVRCADMTFPAQKF